MNNLIKNFIKLGIGILILVLLFYKIGFVQIKDALMQINVLFFPLIIVIFIFSLIGNSLNLFVLAKVFNKNLKYLGLLKYSLWSWGYGMMLPGKIGEFSLAYFLKKKDFSVTESVIVVFLDKIISFAVLFIIASIGFLIFFDFIIAIKIITFLFLILLGGLLFVFTKMGKKLIKKFIFKRFIKHFDEFSRGLKYLIFKRKAVLSNVLITFFRWGLNFLAIYLIFLSLKVNINYFALSTITATSTISSFIPISFGGLGIKEAIGVILFKEYGIAASIAGVSLVLFTAINYFFAIIFIINNLSNKE